VGQTRKHTIPLKEKGGDGKFEEEKGGETQSRQGHTEAGSLKKRQNTGFPGRGKRT